MNCFDGTFSMGKAFALAGAVGKAVRNVLKLNGFSQYAVAPRVDEIDLDDPELEFEIEWSGAWDYGLGVVAHINGLSQAYGIQLAVLYSGKVRFYNKYLDGSIVSSYTLSRGESYTARLVCRQSEITLYVNGAVDVATVSLWSSDVGGLSIGCQIDKDGVTPRDFYRGQLRDIKIWTGGDRNTGTLTRYYRMDEGWMLNPLLEDSSGNNQDGTYFGLTEASWTEEEV